VAELQRVVRGFKPGDVIELEVMRFGDKKTFKVHLAEPPAPEETVASADRGDNTPSRRDAKSYDRLGITVQPITDEVANAANIKDDYRHGLMVTNVSSRGPAYRELVTSDVIIQALHPKRDIKSAADLEAVVKSIKSGDVLTLVVYNVQAGATRVINLSLDQ